MITLRNVHWSWGILGSAAIAALLACSLGAQTPAKPDAAAKF